MSNESTAQPPSTPIVSALNNPQMMQESILLLRLAHEMEKDMEQYMSLPLKTRERKALKNGNYELLSIRARGLFDSALEGKLHTGDVGKLFNIFASSGGNIEKVKKELFPFIDKQIAPLDEWLQQNSEKTPDTEMISGVVKGIMDTKNSQ